MKSRRLSWLALAASVILRLRSPPVRRLGPGPGPWWAGRLRPDCDISCEDCAFGYSGCREGSPDDAQHTVEAPGAVDHTWSLACGTGRQHFHQPLDDRGEPQWRRWHALPCRCPGCCSSIQPRPAVSRRHSPRPHRAGPAIGGSRLWAITKVRAIVAPGRKVVRLGLLAPSALLLTASYTCTSHHLSLSIAVQPS